ncbi:hypothetical protein BAUCODRAFT_373376 [Baudoinia panamericana UAMH 10762]|uniref:SEC7 domain-containing protein n=1 Tax=Baudoinia panamericana (strain UAMH 10762) TaxID=717646 RepID=M2NLF0_BAUPA|nr:uncharacterized protein BAUCODRAFT_373376 [Baudoinia panamericana UAMH 10762]EMD00315.1 hypothetical protein BAUCODRAFT_373376 [Baudoinia panamericana UAMH 10762]
MDAGSSATAGPSQLPPTYPHSPPIALSKRTSSRNALNFTYQEHAGSPPTTPPPNRTKASRKGKEPVNAHRTSRRDQLRGEDRERKGHETRDSWSSTTRDSVVDNLLFSLDSFSSQALPDDMDNDVDFDKEKYRFPQIPELPQFLASKPSQRPRGHTYSSSLSSGYENAKTGGTPGSKFSSSSKNRRSVSSSQFGTITSKTRAARTGTGVSQASSDTQRKVTNGAHAKNTSSDIDSLDYGYSAVIESTNRLPNRRSVSMDHLFGGNPTGQSVLDRGRPVPSVYSKFESGDDAAPEPGVPAGPRRKQNPTATGPVYVNAAPTKHSIRKVHTQNDLRSANNPLPPVPHHVQEQASDFVRANSLHSRLASPSPREQAPPMPGPNFPSISRKDTPSPHREKPGFFKRVWGAASRTATGLSDRSDSMDSYDHLDRAKSHTSTDTSRPSDVRKSSRDQSAATRPPPALSKKPSSFFRRRKKSNTENDRPPLPYLQANVKPAEPSPTVSSLRKVMDPFLTHDGAAEALPGEPLRVGREAAVPESPADDSDDLDFFHSGYTPPRDASLGRRDPMRRDVTVRGKPKQSTDREESPRMKIRMKKRNAETEYFERLRADAAPTSHPALAPGQPKISPMSETPNLEAPPVKEIDRPVSRASTGDRIIASQGNSPIEPTELMNSFNIPMNPGANGVDDGWVVVRPTGPSTERPDSKKSERLFLRPTEAEEKLPVPADEAPPLGEDERAASMKSTGVFTEAAESMEQSPQGTSSIYHSTTSLQLPSLQIEGLPRLSGDTFLVREVPSPIEEGAEYRERARRIFDGDETDPTPTEAASWLGEKTTLSARTLQAYMGLFDFAGMNILAALRALCGRLLLKGETQQFDRIITALSERWCECNPNHGFKAQDVVHTICYSLILLNTDLHMADIGEKMSRAAYVKNTLPTIRRVVVDAAPNAFDDTVKPSPNSSRPSLPWLDSQASAPGASAVTAVESSGERPSMDLPRPNANTLKRLSIRPGVFRSESDGWYSDSSGVTSASNALVNQPWTGSLRGWEFEVENVLKSFFGSIRAEPLPLVDPPLPTTTPSSERNLSAPSSGALKRTGSVVSKAPSENMSYRSKPGARTMMGGWQNRANRSRPKLYPASTVASSRTSFDEGNSAWSPAQSSMWSKNSVSKTLTSASMNSLSYHLSPVVADYKHSIGFANALSQAIIREEGGSIATDDGGSMSIPGSLLEDESLALEGAPWAKEGLVKHKHHLEAPDRKSRDRDWKDCFAVISKGRLTLFAFGTTTKSLSMGRKAHARQTGGSRAPSLAATKVGGGDWMEHAEQLDTFILRHTIASTLPPPGYSKTRPHVWALSLSSGAVHLFHVGTPEIANEFVTSANYWSARLSKEPLSGGVSNIEYGWSDQAINIALILPDRPDSSAAFKSPPSTLQNLAKAGQMHSSAGVGSSPPIGGPRTSFQSSMRGSFDTGFGAGARNRLPGDKVQIAEWQPPSQSMMASQLLEVDQLRQLTEYVNGVEGELERHGELKHVIDLAYSPRHPNHTRAMTNWQRKSDYLLREIVKFRTYMDSLAAAQTAKDRFYAKKVEQQEAASVTATNKSGNTTAKEGPTLLPKSPANSSRTRSPAGSGKFREQLDPVPKTAG